MLKIYLTSELLHREDGRLEILVDLAKALLRLIPREKSLITDLERILERICELDPTADSQALLVEILESKDRPDLSAEVTEKLYVVQRDKLIEMPIVENLLENLRNNSWPQLKLQKSKNMDELLEKTVDSPTIFQISCSVLKELFLRSKHSQRVLDYIKIYLESLSSLCQEKNRNILDLYPLRVQAAVILLRIAPNYHSRFSREHTIDLLMRIHEINPEETLILMTHFPGWLTLFSDRLAENSRIENYRISGDTVTFDKSRSVSPMMID